MNAEITNRRRHRWLLAALTAVAVAASACGGSSTPSSTIGSDGPLGTVATSPTTAEPAPTTAAPVTTALTVDTTAAPTVDSTAAPTTAAPTTAVPTTVAPEPTEAPAAAGGGRSDDIFAEARADVLDNVTRTDVMAAANALVPVFEEVPIAADSFFLSWNVSVRDLFWTPNYVEGELQFRTEFDYFTEASIEDIEAMYRLAIPELGYVEQRVSTSESSDGSTIITLRYDAFDGTHLDDSLVAPIMTITIIEGEVFNVVDVTASFRRVDTMPARLSRIAESVPAPAGTRVTEVLYSSLALSTLGSQSITVSMQVGHHRVDDTNPTPLALMESFAADLPQGGWSVLTPPDPEATSPSLKIRHDASGSETGSSIVTVTNEHVIFNTRYTERIQL